MSYTIREPSLHATPVLELRPTQMTLGLREVALKRKAWEEQGLARSSMDFSPITWRRS